MISLTLENPVSDHLLGATTVRYQLTPGGIVELLAFPTSLADRLAVLPEFETGPHIDHLPQKWRTQTARLPEWLVQLKLAGSPEPGGHQIGRSLRGAEDVQGLSLVAHESAPFSNGGREIVTTLAHGSGATLRHVLRWHAGDAFFRVHVEFDNTSAAPLVLEYLPSFSLGGLTPFHPDEAAELLKVHRFRSTWSAEGRHDAALLEDISLDRSWIGFNRRTLRFGQTGSLPVREFFPWVGIEDTAASVFWGAHLSAPGSWNLEVSRQKDKVILSGGLPSRDFGDWSRTVAPGETFATPVAALACVHGDLDDLCHALTSAQVAAVKAQPAVERDLPMVFNEWCSSWGEPTHDYVIATARRLAATRTRVLVIDDGWAEKPAGQDIQFNGDWVVDRKKFPQGLRATTDAVRALGIIPGIWFEMEAATKGTKAYELTDHHLRFRGRTVQVGNRHFWDFRDEWTHAYLAEKLLARLRDDGFGYLKIDYNESLPVGVDGEHSSGAALLDHLFGVQRFLARLRRELPELIIENCSSGGHRLEPSFMALCAQGSFSDAHETLSIPIVAANLHRLILPRQSQIWAVLHADDTPRYFRYKLAATFLGRMCLSGEVSELSDAQLADLVAAQDFYTAAVPVIRDGQSRLVRHALGKSWNKPHGWQAVVRHTSEAVLVVVHAFALPADESAKITFELPAGSWKVTRTYALEAAAEVKGSTLVLQGHPPFSGAAMLLVGL